jgi:hypothetical protein
MRIINIRPSKKFRGAWAAVEATGVEPAFATSTPKADAISYACGRFGGSCGEIHVYDDVRENIVEKIAMETGSSIRTPDDHPLPHLGGSFGKIGASIAEVVSPDAMTMAKTLKLFLDAFQPT